jgi:hypothetical protein
MRVVSRRPKDVVVSATPIAAGGAESRNMWVSDRDRAGAFSTFFTATAIESLPTPQS